MESYLSCLLDSKILIMGHDIDICLFSIKDGTASKISTESEIYLSYNWGDLKEICLTHFLYNNGNCPDESNCQKIHLWYFRDDCHARKGADIIPRIQSALNILHEHDIVPGIPDLTNPNWSYGTSGTGRLVAKERVAIFAYHLTRFLEQAVKYPDCFFIGDIESDCDLISSDGTLIPQSNNHEDLDVDSGPVTYFRHPFKGNFRVDNFKSAMEVYGITSAQNDPRAESWYTLAFEMFDAPK